MDQQPPISLSAVAQDTRILSKRLKESSTFDPTLRQLMTQILTYEKNESEVEGWLDTVGPMLDEMEARHRAELQDRDRKIAELAEEVCGLRVATTSRVDNVTASHGLVRPLGVMNEDNTRPTELYPEKDVSGTA